MAEKKYDVPVTTTQTGDRGIPSLDSQANPEGAIAGIENTFNPLMAEKKYDVPVTTTQTGDRGIPDLSGQFTSQDPIAGMVFDRAVEKKYDVPVTTTQTGDRGIPTFSGQFQAGSIESALDYIENQVTNPGMPVQGVNPVAGMGHTPAPGRTTPEFPELRPDSQAPQALNLDYEQKPNDQE